MWLGLLIVGGARVFEFVPGRIDAGFGVMEYAFGELVDEFAAGNFLVGVYVVMSNAVPVEIDDTFAVHLTHRSVLQRRRWFVGAASSGKGVCSHTRLS